VTIRRPVTGAGFVWLVRHAPTAWTGRRWCGRSDPPLTTAGQAAAERVAATVAAEVTATRPSSVVILTSPLRRAIETGRSIADRLPASIEIDDGLAEIDFGVADGLTWDELAVGEPALAADILAGAEPDWPGGETAADVAIRAAAVGERIVAAAQSSAVVVVSHAGLLRWIARDLGANAVTQGLEPATAIQLELTEHAPICR